MTCSDFVARLSDRLDGIAPEAEVREAAEHEASCVSCRRYREVIEGGAETFRALPGPDLPDDFRRRLRQRIRREESEAWLHRHSNSGSTAVTVTAMAVLVSAVAWWPALRRPSPVVEMTPIVVSRPPLSYGLLARAADPFQPADASLTVRQVGLWDDAPALLYQHSVLSRRYPPRTAESQTVALDP